MYFVFQGLAVSVDRRAASDTPDNSALCSSIWRYSRDTLSIDNLLLGKLSTELSSMGNNFGTATFNDEMIAEYANLSGLSENQVNVIMVPGHPNIYFIGSWMVFGLNFLEWQL